MKHRNLTVHGPAKCVKCVESEPCLWKLEAQIDAIQQHSRIAIKLMRKIAARQTILLEVQPKTEASK